MRIKMHGNGSKLHLKPNAEMFLQLQLKSCRKSSLK